MLRSILVSASLEGLEPGWRPPRPPVPVVWFDRIRRARGAPLNALATDLATRTTFPPVEPAAPAPSATAAMEGGWRVVLCGDGSAVSSLTLA